MPARRAPRSRPACKAGTRARLTCLARPSILTGISPARTGCPWLLFVAITYSLRFYCGSTFPPDVFFWPCLRNELHRTLPAQILVFKCWYWDPFVPRWQPSGSSQFLASLVPAFRNSVSRFLHQQSLSEPHSDAAADLPVVPVGGRTPASCSELGEFRSNNKRRQ